MLPAQENSSEGRSKPRKKCSWPFLSRIMFPLVVYGPTSPAVDPVVGVDEPALELPVDELLLDEARLDELVLAPLVLELLEVFAG